MEQRITWEIEKQECGHIAEIIRYALSTVRRTGFETYSGIANFGFLQREIDALEQIYFQFTGKWLENEYGKRAIEHWHSQQVFLPQQLSLSEFEGEFPANNAINAGHKDAE